MENDTICRSVGHLTSVALAVSLVACAPTEKPEFDTGPQSEYGELRTFKPAVDAQGYELEPVFKPGQVLPPEMAKGKHHEVVGDVVRY